MKASAPAKVKIHTDGGARGNPGPAAAGFVILSADDDSAIRKEGIFLGRATNNVAEYRAVIAALHAANHLGAKEVELYSDSELLVRQVNGQYRVKNAGLKPLYLQVRELADAFEKCEFHHVRRHQNEDADALVNQSLDMKQNVGDAVSS